VLLGVTEIYDQCNPSNALDYEDDDNFRIAPGSPNVRLTTYQRNARSTRDKRSALLGDPDEESVTPPPARPAADPFFKLVPSSSSVGGGGNQGSMTGGGVNAATAGYGGSSLAGASPRRPPAPTAANTSAPNAPISPKANGGGAAGGGNNKWPPSASVKTIDWREEMKRFYIAIGMPEKIAGINTILSTWAGKEEQMIASLMEKYRASIPAQMSTHLEQLLSHLETHSESSFVRGPPINSTAALPPPPASSSPRSPPRSARRNKL